MGNFAAIAALGAQAPTAVAVVSAATPSDMKAKIDAAVAAASGNGYSVVDICLEGAGNGDDFVCVLQLYLGLIIGSIRYFFAYEAASPSELTAAANATIAEIGAIPNANVAAFALSGNAKGNRYMGVMMGAVPAG